jgi:FhuF 2Fe-2S C-terminal domain
MGPVGPMELTGSRGLGGLGLEVDAESALAAAAGAGPYFAVEAWVPEAGWRPVRELAADPEVLAGRVAYARADIAGRAGVLPAEVTERVAASIVFLGLAARLVSPSLGAAVLGGVVPSLTLDNLWWRPVDGGPVPLVAGSVTGREIGGGADQDQAGGTGAGDQAGGDQAGGDWLDEAAGALSLECVRGLVEPVAEAFRELFRVSPLILRGNIASALAGAAGMLATGFPDRAETAGQLTVRILDLPPLRGSGEFVQPDASNPRRFLVRRSCCLYYRVPGGRLCGDCVLTPEHVRRQQWQAALHGAWS